MSSQPAVTTASAVSSQAPAASQAHNPSARMNTDEEAADEEVAAWIAVDDDPPVSSNNPPAESGARREHPSKSFYELVGTELHICRITADTNLAFYTLTKQYKGFLRCSVPFTYFRDKARCLKKFLDRNEDLTQKFM